MLASAMRGVRLAIGLSVALFAGRASADDVQDAQSHFQRARELYSSGKYAQARHELETAYDLDPAGKDLVFNLGIVCEKLNKYDDAIRYLKIYLGMELTPLERGRAESSLKRIEGAKSAAPASVTDNDGRERPPTVLVAEAPAPSIGRFDGFTVAAGSLAIASAGVAVGFGLGALVSRPSSGFMTGRDGTFQDLKSKADNAHTLAIVADVGIISAAVFTALTAYLFFGRKSDPRRGRTSPAVTVTRGGAIVALQGAL